MHVVIGSVGRSLALALPHYDDMFTSAMRVDRRWRVALAQSAVGSSRQFSRLLQKSVPFFSFFSSSISLEPFAFCAQRPFDFPDSAAARGRPTDAVACR